MKTARTASEVISNPDARWSGAIRSSLSAEARVNALEETGRPLFPSPEDARGIGFRLGGGSEDPILPEGGEGRCAAPSVHLKDNSTPLVESWDGSGWRLQSTPTAGITDAALTSVSCTSQTFCMAIGTNANNIFAEDYDGQPMGVWRHR